MSIINSFIEYLTIPNILVIMISYIIGSLLPAELISWVVKRKPCSEIGTGNPGFANIASNIGLFAGLLVLAGDVGKTYLGMRVSYDFTQADTVLATSLLSLCALVVGHNFPLWNLFHGGKGVAVTCAGIIFITPTLGIPSCLIGFALVLLTGYLPLGAVCIPAVYLMMCWVLLPEAVPYAIFLAVMMLIRHLPGIISIFTGKCPKAHPFAFLKRKKKASEPEPDEEEDDSPYAADRGQAAPVPQETEPYSRETGMASASAEADESGGAYAPSPDEASGEGSPSPAGAQGSQPHVHRGGRLKTPEELRRHPIGAMESVPETKASSSLSQSSKHPNRLSIHDSGEGVIFYTLDKKKESKAAAAEEDKDKGE